MNAMQRPPNAQILQRLRRGNWFAGLPESLQQALTDASEFLHFTPDEYIVEQGQQLEGRLRS